MPGLKATALALLTVGTLAVGGCNRENPPSTNVQGPPDSEPQPVPTPTDNTGAPASTGSPSDTGTSGATGTGPTAGARPATGTPPQGSETGTAAGTDASAVNSSHLTLSDQNFLTSAATAGLLEVAAARAAASQAANADVKAYAGMLLKDHTATNADLSTLAAQKNLNLPTEIGAGQTPTLEALTNARGADFDRLFVQSIGVGAHRSDIALFEQAARDARDADVRAFAGKALPKLRDHLAAALKLPGASAMGTNAPAGSERKGN